MEPCYNEVLGTMKFTLLYQVSHYIRVKKTKKYKALGPEKITLLYESYVISDPLYNDCNVISDLFITIVMLYPTSL